jgi:glucose-fructose oxidoreductase
MIAGAISLAGAGVTSRLHAAAVDRPPANKTEKVGWAVLGLGNFAGLVLPKFAQAQKGRLAALVSGTPDKLARIGEQYAVPPSARYGYDDWDRIRNDPRIDVVYVITPVGTHADFALEALRAGKHVFVEKTMAESSARARAMISAADDAGRKLAVAYRVWHDPANRLLMEMARKEELGQLATVMAHKGTVMKLPPSDWRFDPRLAGGGALVDLGIYSIQAARYVAGNEPLEVQATVFSDPVDARYRRVEQNIAWTMRFPGALASCTASWNYSGQNNIRAAFRDGFISLDPATLGARNRIFVGRDRGGTFGVEEQSVPFVDQLVRQIDHFSEAVLNQTAPMTDGYEGLRDILAIEALYRSVQSGRIEKVAIV